MPSSDFPLKQSRTLGQFWLPGHEDKQVTGNLEVVGSDVRLDVSPGLTPFHTFTPIEGGGWGIGTTPDPPDMVILGSIPLSPRLVSVWDAITTSRSGVGLPNPLEGDLPSSIQGVKGTWCLVGANLEDPDTAFYGIRPDVTNLSQWAWIPASTHTFYPDDRLRYDWHVDLRSKSLDAELKNGAGYVTLAPAASMSPLTIQGFNVSTSSQLEVELFEGWTLTDVVARVLLPLADLMTILSGTTCSARSLEVWAGEWCSVHGYRIDPQAPQAEGELLFSQPEIGLDFLAQWLDLHYRMTPVPQILGAVIRDEFPTVEAQALSLATAVEALHRTLFPTARRFDVEQIESALTALEKSEIPVAIADTFASALRQYWHEYSYPQRVKALAEPVAQAVPDCIGRLGRWKNAIVEQRISLAHGMGEGRLETEQILRMSTLNRSLHWMLVLRLLLEAGVPPTLLHEATSRSDRFQEDRAQWTHHWPHVFQP